MDMFDILNTFRPEQITKNTQKQAKISKKRRP